MRDIFRTVKKFRKAMAERFDSYDYEESCKQRNYNFVTTDGTIYKGTTSIGMFRNMNEVFGEFINTKRSRIRDQKVIVHYLAEAPAVTEASTVDKASVATETAVEVEEATVVTEEVENVVEEAVEAPDTVAEDADVEVSDEEATDESDTTPVFDKAYAESLYDESDKSGSKTALEDYGKTLGIDLKKSKTFENMLIDLEEFCEE